MKNFKFDNTCDQFVYTGDHTKNTTYFVRACEKIIYWQSKADDTFTLVFVDVRGDIVEHFDTEPQLAAYLKQHDLLD